MKFVDEAIIEIKSGAGGRGCVAFRREKYVPRGGPNGGNGGRGGDVLAKATKKLSTLMDFRYKKHFKAPDGGIGMGSLKAGRQGEDLILELPLGTLIYDADTEELLADLVDENQVVTLALGGRGGRGNTAFKSSVNQAPRQAEPGGEAVERRIRLELKLLADVGLVGMPNAGKSTLLSSISHAHPKIADYPFTTLTPNLGVVELPGYQSFTMADIPGLIEGAHEGHGLGIQFLRHIERTKVFLHLVSLGPDEPLEPYKRYQLINKELNAFDVSFKRRNQIILLTKADLLTKKEVAKVVTLFKKTKKKVFVISSITRDGLKDLLKYIGTELKK
ncbi:GTPase ObgE [bacterium]|nr:GTPase ObgE [bacterium]